MSKVHIVYHTRVLQFSSVAQSCLTLATPWIAARQASLSITISQSSFRLTSVESVMPSRHLILCRPLLLLPPIPPSIRVFSNESTLRMMWPKNCSFSFSIIPCKEHPGLISFRMDCIIPSKEIPDQKGFPIMTFDALICSGIVMASKFVSLSSNSEIQIYIKPFG